MIGSYFFFEGEQADQPHPALSSDADYTKLHERNSNDPAIPGRESWSHGKLPRDMPYSGPSDVMKGNAFNEKISCEIGSFRDVPDTRTAG